MSIEATALVLGLSPSLVTSDERLVLLVLADAAADDGATISADPVEFIEHVVARSSLQPHRATIAREMLTGAGYIVRRLDDRYYLDLDRLALDAGPHGRQFADWRAAAQQIDRR